MSVDFPGLSSPHGPVDVVLHLTTGVGVDEHVKLVAALHDPWHDAVERLGEEESGPLGGKERTIGAEGGFKHASTPLVEESLTGLLVEEVELGHELLAKLLGSRDGCRVALPEKDMNVIAEELGLVYAAHSGAEGVFGGVRIYTTGGENQECHNGDEEKGEG